MPTYEFKCNNCGYIEERIRPISDLDNLKQSMYHCGKLMGRLISGGLNSFLRSSFDKDPFEHVDYEPRAFRDKYEMLDFCEEAGLRSRYLEDGDIP